MLMHTLMQNYTYVDPVVDPLVLLAALIGLVVLGAATAAIWSLRVSPPPKDARPEPFVAETACPNALPSVPSELATADRSSDEPAAWAPDRVPAGGDPDRSSRDAWVHGDLPLS